jgi:hypothetical protein
MAGEPRGLQGVRAALQGVSKVTGPIHRGIDRFLTEGPLGAIEVPAPGQNPTAGGLLSMLNPVPETPTDLAITAAIPPAKVVWGAGKSAVKNMKMAPYLARIMKDAKKVGIDKLDDIGMMEWSHKVVRPGIKVPSTVTPSGYIYHHSKTSETYADMVARLQAKGIKKKDMTKIGYFFGEVVDEPTYKQLSTHVDELLTKTDELNYTPTKPNIKPRMEDPRAVERELRTAAGPAGGAVTAPASEITTGIPSRSALSVGAKNVDMERAAAQEQLASLKKVLAASRRIKNKAEHQIHRENDIMGSINELEDVLDLDRTPFTSLFESRPRAETEGLVPYTRTKK